MPTDISPRLVQRYLELLEVEPGPPTISLLRRLVRHHLYRIPFENISKLFYLREYGLRDIPDLERYLDGIERYHFGGTCYSNNVYLNGLLRCLGFDVDLCGADMSEPDVHIVNLVRVEGREYLVDVGYGAPFSQPLPRDLRKDLVVELGNERWVVTPADDEGRTVVEHHRQGRRIHGYVARPTGRRQSHFSAVVRGSFGPDSTFMNTIRLVRYFETGCVAISGDVLYRSTPEAWSLERLGDRTLLVENVERHFGIPPTVVHRGLEALRNL